MNQAGRGNEEIEGDFSVTTWGVSAWHFRANTCGRACETALVEQTGLRVRT